MHSNDLKQTRILAKLNLWMVYNPDFLTYTLFWDDQSLSQKPGLYTIWKYFKKFLFSIILPYTLRMI